MKRIAAAIGLLMVLTGCIPSVKLNERGVVQAIGIDLDGGSYRAVMQVREAVGAPAGANQAGENGQNVIVEASGDTLVTLFTRASATRGRQLFLGNVKAIVIGETAARAGIGEIIGFFNANHHLAPNTPVMVARGEAGELVRAGETDPVFSADGLNDVAQSAYKSGFASRGRLMDIAGAMKGGTGVLPMLECRESNPAEHDPEENAEKTKSAPPEQGKTEKKLLLAGSAVFRADRMAETLDQTATRGLEWTRNRITATSLAVADEQLGTVAAVTHAQKASLALEITGEVPVVNITVDVHSTALEMRLNTGGILDKAARAYAVALQETQIQGEIEQMLAATQRKGLDVLGISHLALQRYPEFYLQNRENWSEIVAGAGYNVEVTCKIDRMGSANRSS